MLTIEVNTNCRTALTGRKVAEVSLSVAVLVCAAGSGGTCIKSQRLMSDPGKLTDNN